MIRNSKNIPNKFTEGSITKSIFALAVPIVLSNLLQTAYQLTDTFWVGRLGANALASVSLSFPIIFLIISLGGGFGTAGAILVAQYKGQEASAEVNHISAQTFLMMFFVSIVLAAAGIIFSPLIVKLMGADKPVMLNAISYMKISFFGMIFTFIYFAFQALMRGVGDVKTPMYIVLFTVILNLVLDPFFIFGFGLFPPMGVTGAAVATLLAQAIAATLGMWLLMNGKYEIRLRRSNFTPDYPLIKKIFRLGLPSSLEQSGRALGMLAMTFIVAYFGTTIIASYGIGMRILSFIIIPSIGLAMATSTLVGQNLGAGKVERAETIAKRSMLAGFLIMGISGLILFIFSREITAAFIPNDKAVIKEGSYLVRVLSVTFGFVSLQQITTGVLRASGKTITSMMLTITSLWLLRFPIAIFLAFYTQYSFRGVWWSFPIANVISVILALSIFFNGSWKKKKLTEEIKVEKAR
jgi:putative MATE family efflux protein